jgi:hypothetical protein
MRGGKRDGAGRPEGIPKKLTQDLRELLQQFSSDALADLPRLYNGLESVRGGLMY